MYASWPAIYLATLKRKLILASMANRDYTGEFFGKDPVEWPNTSRFTTTVLSSENRRMRRMKCTQRI